ncbi:MULTISPECIES: carbohydrate ABC transporter permease [unclassified Ruminococcus]|uniref:carbohydrate ABC transporter permease n=1 Tax=unclassified Ruminococcus TaxID=2608920 RepID=UPI00210F0E3F|nr:MULTISPECIES: sugar ABC transporter permease [unclassified Ruminococcus]MCQ4021664.1 ABC transporter permease subunit [Ruminococcus sp. zg-924]MCQ4114109.1 ABC transporter permease subunit [Ruminococcus sp. zg-921]
MIRKRKSYLIAFLFILPSLLGIAVFYIVPYIICIIKSMYIGNSFVGLANYAELFRSNTFLLALKNTGIFTLIAIPLLMLISFVLALFLNSFKKISSFFRSSFLIPVVVPIASLICVWQVIFDDYGAINAVLNSLGFDAVSFFNSGFSMVMIILIYIWKYCGFCVILFTAGLANIPTSLYESAKLDGASSFQIVRKITIPMITPTTFFVFLMEIIYSFKIFREVFALFGDYPNENIYFLQNFINNNYYNLNYSRLSSASVILSVFIIIVLLVFFLFERKRNFSE